MDYEFGLKELYDLKLKATSKIEIGDRIIEPGEVIAVFDKLQVANFKEITNVVAARGGFDNRGHVFWNSTKEVAVSFTQGICNKSQTTLFTNAKLYECAESSVILTNREYLESDGNGSVELKENPSGTLFVYRLEDGQKVDFTREGKKITISNPYVDLIIDYEYEYFDGGQVLKVGQKLTNGFVALEGRTKIKEDITGTVKTGIIKIPKLKIVSNLSMRLGQGANPLTAGFSAIAVPDGLRGEQYVMEVFLLENDIDSDI